MLGYHAPDASRALGGNGYIDDQISRQFNEDKYVSPPAAREGNGHIQPGAPATPDASDATPAQAAPDPGPDLAPAADAGKAAAQQVKLEVEGWRTLERVTLQDELLAADENAHLSSLDASARDPLHPDRLVYLAGLGATARNADFLSIATVIAPLLHDLRADESQQVREVVAAGVGDVAEAAAQAAEADGDYCAELGIDPRTVPKLPEVLSTLATTCMTMLEDTRPEVQEAAAASAGRVAALLRPGALGEAVLRPLLTLSRHGRGQTRAAAISALFEAVGCVCEAAVERGDAAGAEEGGSPCDAEATLSAAIEGGWDAVMSVARRVAADPELEVQIAAVQGFAKVARHLPLAQAEGAGVAVLREAADSSVWSVRKAAALLTPSLSAAVGPECRRQVVMRIVEELQSDMSAWVRKAVQGCIAQVVASLASQDVPPALVSEFCRMASHHDKEVHVACAHDFPAMVAVLGPERWSELEALFSELCGSVYIEVRTKTGTFLHEVARLLLPGGTATGGAEARERQRQVVEAAEALVGDPEPDVIAATARGAGKLLGCLDEGAARQVLKCLLASLAAGTPTDATFCGPWRMRQAIVGALGEASSILPERDVEGGVVPALLSALGDPVAAVREEAAGQLGRAVCVAAMAGAAVGGSQAGLSSDAGSEVGGARGGAGEVRDAGGAALEGDRWGLGVFSQGTVVEHEPGEGAGVRGEGVTEGEGEGGREGAGEGLGEGGGAVEPPGSHGVGLEEGGWGGVVQVARERGGENSRWLLEEGSEGADEDAALEELLELGEREGNAEPHGDDEAGPGLPTSLAIPAAAQPPGRQVRSHPFALLGRHGHSQSTGHLGRGPRHRRHWGGHAAAGGGVGLHGSASANALGAAGALRGSGGAGGGHGGGLYRAREHSPAPEDGEMFAAMAEQGMSAEEMMEALREHVHQQSLHQLRSLEGLSSTSFHSSQVEGPFPGTSRPVSRAGPAQSSRATESEDWPGPGRSPMAALKDALRQYRSSHFRDRQLTALLIANLADAVAVNAEVGKLVRPVLRRLARDAVASVRECALAASDCLPTTIRDSNAVRDMGKGSQAEAADRAQA